MPDLASVKVTVYGRVQGVFFRAYSQRAAEGLGLTGYARNQPDGSSVEIIAEGERQKLEKLILLLRKGPPGAVVSKISAEWSSHSGRFSGFGIKH